MDKTTLIVDLDKTILVVDPREVPPLLESAMKAERERILTIIEGGAWEVFGNDYYQTSDSPESIAKLKALILGEPK